MFLLFSIILFLNLDSIRSIDIFPNKLTGTGLPCSNRKWANYPMSAALRESALQSKFGPLPFFNDTIYLAGVYNRVQSDAMLQNLYFPLRQLVLVECADYKGEFIETIENYLNNIVSVKSWAGVAHDLNFDYFYGRAYWVELFSSNPSYHIFPVFNF
jgi:hypothetical protein